MFDENKNTILVTKLPSFLYKQARDQLTTKVTHITDTDENVIQNKNNTLTLYSQHNLVEPNLLKESKHDTLVTTLTFIMCKENKHKISFKVRLSTDTNE